MTRKIKLTDLKAAVDEAYEKFANAPAGTPDPRVEGIDPNTFGISVVLADGTVISKGDTKTAVPMGNTMLIPLHAILLTQMTPDQLAEKSGKCPYTWTDGKKPQKPHTPFNSHALRAISAIEPSNDSDGKWDIISDMLTSLMGTSPELDDALYKKLTAQAVEAKVEDNLAAASYFLYDDAKIAIDLYAKFAAMKAGADQLATMGATIAADGVNPETNEQVFDGNIAAPLVSTMAVKSLHKMSGPWMLRAGLPAKSGFGGSVVGVLPGVMGIAAVAPGLNMVGVSEKASQALLYIMQKLGLSVYSSACVEFEK